MFDSRKERMSALGFGLPLINYPYPDADFESIDRSYMWGSFDFALLSKYVDILAAGGGIGTSVDPWNLADIQALPYGSNSGYDIYIKNYDSSALVADLNGIVGAASLRNWVASEPFAFNIGSFDWVNQAYHESYTLSGAIVNTDTIGIPHLAEKCLFYMTNDFLMSMYSAGTFTGTFKGCTFSHDTLAYLNMVPHAAGVLTLAFEHCLFKNVRFDTPGATDVVVTCKNCTFTETQANVVLNFGGTISFDGDCRFEKTVTVPTYNEVSSEGGKYYLDHEQYLIAGTDNLGPEGYAYGGTVSGLFGEPRRAVGAWLFRREYYCDVSQATTGDDGLLDTTPFGITELQDHFDTAAQELDRIYCFGVGTGITLSLPTDLRAWNSLSLTRTYYHGITLAGYDDKFYLSEAALHSITLGSSNEIINLVTDAYDLLATQLGKHYIYNCTFLISGGTVGIYADGNVDEHEIAGCNFVCDEVQIEGDTSICSGTAIITHCLFADGATIIAGAALSSLSIVASSFHGTVELDHDFSTINSQSDNKFDIHISKAMPVTLAGYNESNICFHDYDFGGSLDAPWPITSGPALTDAWGNDREGVGDFNFVGSYEATEYWCDMEGVDGYGTEAFPWSAAQLRLYTTSTIGYQVADGDIVNIKGKFDATGIIDQMFLFEGHANNASVRFRKWGNEQFFISCPCGAGAFIFVQATTNTLNLRIDGMVLSMDANDTVGGISGDLVNLSMYNSQIFLTISIPFAFNISSTSTIFEMYGSILSVDAAVGVPIFIYNAEANSHFNLYDTVLNISSTTAIQNLFGFVSFDNVETNVAYTYFSVEPNITISNSGFNNASIATLPFTESIATYNEADYDYRNYNLTITGKGTIFWTSNEYQYGLIGFTRLGIGAFIFPADEYYVNFDNITTGAGTEADPWNRSQLRDFFGIAGHDESGYTVSDGIIVNITGSITDWDLIDGYFLDIGATVAGTVLIKGWDIETNGMYILDTTSNVTHSFFSIVNRNASHYISNLIIKDLCFIQNDVAGSYVLLNDIFYVGTDETNIDIKNSMFFAYSGSFNLISDYTNIALYGCNVYDNSALSLFYPMNGTVSIYDSALQLAAVDAGATGTLTVVNSETNIAEVDFTTSGATLVFTTCVFESAIPTLLPSDLTAATFSRDTFLYANYPFTSTGSGDTFWIANDFNNGISGEYRDGIGAFYFYEVIPVQIKTYHPIETEECSEDDIATRTFWDYISTFWNFLHEKDREMIENFWHGLYIAGYSLIKKMTRLNEVAAPEDARICTFDDYYDIKLGAMYSKPMMPDPTDESIPYIIVPVDKVLVKPVYDSNNVATYNDLIQIKARDYYKLREVAIGAYVIITVKNDNIQTKYFKVKNMLSSEEDPTSDRYYQPASLSGSPQRSLYMVELDEGNLEYIGTNSFSIYFTTGLAYDINTEVLSLPTLQTYITENQGIEFKVDQDYTFLNNILEFNNDIFDRGIVQGQFIYSKKTPIIEHYLFESYGKLIGIEDWQRFHYTNISGKAAVNAAIKSMQNSSNLEDYNRLMNVLYGLPVTPEDGEVVGLYESYGYTVSVASGNYINLQIEDGVEMSGLIQDGCEFWIDDKPVVQVRAVLDRSTAYLQLFDGTDVEVGDLMYLRLPNALPIKSAIAETDSVPASFTIYTPEHQDMLNHVVTMIRNLSNNTAYPEITVYGTDNDLGSNYDGVYHMTTVSGLGLGYLKAYVYHHDNDSEPTYNDYVFTTDSSINRGFFHVQWPTHKFLLLYMKDSNKYYKAYMDSPIDTILDRGDKVTKYQVLSRTVSAVNTDIFPAWNQFNVFKKFNGLDENVCLIEGTSIIPHAQFGEYLPSEYR